MSQENIDTLRRGYAAYEPGDVAAMLESADPSIVTYRADPEGATWHDPEGLLEAMGDWFEGFTEFDARAELFIDAGDSVVVRIHPRARGASSGATVEGDFWFVHTVKDGKQVRLEMFIDRSQAFEAAGLQE